MIGNVNHPKHYKSGKFECIDVMLETQGLDAVKSFCLLNAFKYLYRHRNKNGIEDIKKAQWYINKYVELSTKKNDADLSCTETLDKIHKDYMESVCFPDPLTTLRYNLEKTKNNLEDDLK